MLLRVQATVYAWQKQDKLGFAEKFQLAKEEAFNAICGHQVTTAEGHKHPRRGTISAYRCEMEELWVCRWR